MWGSASQGFGVVYIECFVSLFRLNVVRAMIDRFSRYVYD